MGSLTIFLVVAMLLFAAAAGVLSFMQFMGYGALINNLYDPESDGDKDKKPYFRQTGIVLALLAAILVCNSMALLLHLKWIFAVVGVLVAGLVAYTLVSTILLNRKNQENTPKNNDNDKG